MNNIEIGERLLYLRVHQGLKQREMGAIFNVSIQQYQKYENGKDGVSLKRFIGLCDHLMVDPCEVLEIKKLPDNYKEIKLLVAAFNKLDDKRRETVLNIAKIL